MPAIKEVLIVKARVNKKILLAVGAPIVALGITGGVFALQHDTPQVKKESKEVAVVDNKTSQSEPVQDISTEQPEQVIQQTVAQEEPAPTPTNPYPEGFNIWHVWNRRTELSLTTPDGNKSDATWCRDVINTQGHPSSSEPTQYAIVCSSQGVLGLIETVHADGSITISCTNCGAGWNVLSEKTIPADQINRYKYLQ